MTNRVRPVLVERLVSPATQQSHEEYLLPRNCWFRMTNLQVLMTSIDKTQKIRVRISIPNSARVVRTSFIQTDSSLLATLNKNSAGFIDIPIDVTVLCEYKHDVRSAHQNNLEYDVEVINSKVLNKSKSIGNGTIDLSSVIQNPIESSILLIRKDSVITVSSIQIQRLYSLVISKTTPPPLKNGGFVRYSKQSNYGNNNSILISGNKRINDIDGFGNNINGDQSNNISGNNNKNNYGNNGLMNGNNGLIILDDNLSDSETSEILPTFTKQFEMTVQNVLAKNHVIVADEKTVEGQLILEALALEDFSIGVNEMNVAQFIFDIASREFVLDSANPFRFLIASEDIFACAVLKMFLLMRDRGLFPNDAFKFVYLPLSGKATIMSRRISAIVQSYSNFFSYQDWFSLFGNTLNQSENSIFTQTNSLAKSSKNDVSAEKGTGSKKKYQEENLVEIKKNKLKEKSLSLAIGKPLLPLKIFIADVLLTTSSNQFIVPMILIFTIGDPNAALENVKGNPLNSSSNSINYLCINNINHSNNNSNNNNSSIDNDNIGINNNADNTTSNNNNNNNNSKKKKMDRSYDDNSVLNGNSGSNKNIINRPMMKSSNSSSNLKQMFEGYSMRCTFGRPDGSNKSQNVKFFFFSIENKEIINSSSNSKETNSSKDNNKDSKDNKDNKDNKENKDNKDDNNTKSEDEKMMINMNSTNFLNATCELKCQWKSTNAFKKTSVDKKKKKASRIAIALGKGQSAVSVKIDGILFRNVVGATISLRDAESALVLHSP